MNQYSPRLLELAQEAEQLAQDGRTVDKLRMMHNFALLIIIEFHNLDTKEALEKGLLKGEKDFIQNKLLERARDRLNTK